MGGHVAGFKEQPLISAECCLPHAAFACHLDGQVWRNPSYAITKYICLFIGRNPSMNLLALAIVGVGLKLFTDGRMGTIPKARSCCPCATGLRDAINSDSVRPAAALGESLRIERS